MPRQAHAPPAPPEERAERVGVAVCVARPVLDARVDDVELEGEDMLEDVRARRGLCDAHPPSLVSVQGHFSDPPARLSISSSST